MSISQILLYAGYGVVFLVMISILVAAHELGHYLFARLFNMGVEEFAIGFGKRPIVTWGHRTYTLPIMPGEDPDHKPLEVEEGTGMAASMSAPFEGKTPNRHIEKIQTPTGPALRETTDFTIRPWPLGGFVRIKGMIPEEDGSETKITGGFYSKPPWQRFFVLLAGPLFSVLAGVLVLIPVLMIDGKDEKNFGPVLGPMVQDKPAYVAGLRPDDKVLDIDGKPVKSFYDMVVAVRESKGKPLDFHIQRGESFTRHIKVTPYLDKEATPLLGPDLEASGQPVKTYKLGVLPGFTKTRLSFGAAVTEALLTPVEAVNGLIKIFKQPQKFKESVGGPATMVDATAAAVDHGIWKVLWLSAVLSISVGIMNLLPAPPLDGGQMLMSIVEMFRRGRRLSLKAQAIAGGIGLTFVAALILSVFVVDAQRYLFPSDRPNIALPKD